MVLAGRLHPPSRTHCGIRRLSSESFCCLVLTTQASTAAEPSRRTCADPHPIYLHLVLLFAALLWHCLVEAFLQACLLIPGLNFSLLLEQESEAGHRDRRHYQFAVLYCCKRRLINQCNRRRRLLPDLDEVGNQHTGC